MKVYLYDQIFEINETNICEGRGKYLVRSAINNADKFIKSECQKCRAVLDMTQKIPQITGLLILNVTQHMLYILQLEGIYMNAQEYIDSTFNITGSVCQKVCDALTARAAEIDKMSTSQLRELPDKLTAASILDLQNLWIGYFRAHGYSLKNEFYTYQKLDQARKEIATLSEDTPLYLASKICSQALYNVPYEESYYDITENLVGEDKNLEIYKNWFTTLFKPGTYKDMLNKNHFDELKDEIVNKIYSMCETPEFRFKSYIYYASGTTDKGVKKFNMAFSTYAKEAKIEDGEERPLVCLDSTRLGGGEDGLIITTKGIYLHNDKEEAYFFNFNDIKSVIIEGLISKKIYINGYKIDTAGMSNSDIKRFHTLINKIRDIVVPLCEIHKKHKPSKKEINDFILSLKNNSNYNFDRNVYIYNDKDEKAKKKFKSAMSSYAKLVIDEYPLICFDNTIFGSAEDGFVMTNEGIHIHNYKEDTMFFSYENIKALKFIDNDIYIDRVNVKTGFSDEDKKRLFDLMKRIRDYFVNF